MKFLVQELKPLPTQMLIKIEIVVFLRLLVPMEWQPSFILEVCRQKLFQKIFFLANLSVGLLF